MASGEWMFVYFTHVEDGLRARQGPYLILWGQKDRSVYLHLERALGALSPYLVASNPPVDLSTIGGQIIVFLLDRVWVRGKLIETSVSPLGQVDVFCIDFGSVHSIPLAYVRVLDPNNPSPEVSLVNQCQPLAQKFFLADVVSPQDLWPDHAIRFAKAVLENQTWRGISLSTRGNVTGIQLFNEKNEMLAKTMIDNGMGVPAQNYSATKNVVPVIEVSGTSFPSSNYPRPAIYPPTRVPAPTLPARIDNFRLARQFPHPVASSGDQFQLPIPSSMQNVAPTRSVSPNQFTQSSARREMSSTTPLPPSVPNALATSASGRAYVASDMKPGMMYDVIVTNIEDGVKKFSVQLKESEPELKELRRKLDNVDLKPMKNPIRGSPCLALFSQDQLLHRGLVTQCQDDKCSVYYIDYGNLDVLDSRYIFEIPDDLMGIKLHACRVGLAESEDLEHLDGVSEAFSSIVDSKSFKCQVVGSDRPQRVVMYDEMGRNLKDLILTMINKGPAFSKLSFSPSQHLIPAAKAPHRRDAKPALRENSPTNVTRVALQIGRQNIQPEEQIFVTCVHEVGKFFGQLERLPMEELNQIQAELLRVYGSLNEKPLLFADVKSHAGEYAVVKWSQDHQFYRVKIQEEFANEVEVWFVDYGNVLKVPKYEVLAPVTALTSFSKPNFGIFCHLSSVTASPEQWEVAIADQSIHIKIVESKNNLYSVIFTNHPINKKIADALKISMPSNQLAKTSAPVVNPLTPTSWATPPLASREPTTTAPSILKSFETPPAVKASTFVSWDTPPAQAQPSWETPPDAIKPRSESSWDTPPAPVKQPIPVSWDTPPSNTNAQSAGRANDSANKKTGWNNQDVQNGDWRRPGSRFGALQPNNEEGKQDKNWNSSNGQSKRVSWGKTETSPANTDTNWRSGNIKAKDGEDRDQTESRSFGNRERSGSFGAQNRPPRFNLQPTLEKQSARVVSPTPSPTPLVYLPQTVLANVSKTVEVVFVNSPVDFYCQLSEAIEPLDQLMAQLATNYEDASKPSVTNPKKGDSCVAQYVEDSAWYRGQILSVDGQDADVLFVDYGNKQRSKLAELKAIEKAFLALPPQAYRCCLTAIDAQSEWTPEAKTKFEDLTMSKQLQASFIRRGTDGKYHVRLVHVSEEDGNSNVVLNESYGAPPASNVPQPVGGCAPFELPSGCIDVTVSWFYHSCKFFLAPTISDDQQFKLDQLDEFYSSLGPHELIEDEPRVGLLCVARFAEDNRFYRSEIIDIRGDVTRVLFVDYGNEQGDTPLKSLKRIVPHFLTFPKLTLPCQIKDVKRVTPPKPDYQTHEAACFVSGGDISVQFYPADSSGIYSVEVTAKKIGNVREYLIEKGVVEAKVEEVQEEVRLPELDREYAQGQEIAEGAIIPFMVSASEFWIQPKPDEVDVLMAQIDEWSSNVEFASKSLRGDISVGRVCLAQYPDDGRWYRAMIKAIEEAKATVSYVDYGNTCIVDIPELRELPSNLAQLPPQALKCSLDGIEYSEENVDEAFGAMYEDLVVSAKYVKMVDERLSVRLVDSSDGIDLNQKLGLPTVEEVYISYTQSPHQFWVQLKSNENTVAEIGDKLSILDEGGDFSVESPGVNEIYAVKHPEYETWFRAQLKSITADQVDAHFIDYGDSAMVATADIRRCPEAVTNFEPMAFKCGLKLNVPPELKWSEGPVIALLKAAADEVLRALFCGEENGVKLIRSLMTKEQDLVQVIEEVVKNSANKQTAREHQTGSSAEQEQAVHEGDELTMRSDIQCSRETGVADVRTEEEARDVSVLADVTMELDTKHQLPTASQQSESTADANKSGPPIIGNPADEHSAESGEPFDGSSARNSETTCNLTDPATQATRRNSVAEKINLMESLIRGMTISTSPTSPTREAGFSFRPSTTGTSSFDLQVKTGSDPQPESDAPTPTSETADQVIAQAEEGSNIEEKSTFAADAQTEAQPEKEGTTYPDSEEQSQFGENSEDYFVAQGNEVGGSASYPEVNEVEVAFDVSDAAVEIRVDAADMSQPDFGSGTAGNSISCEVSAVESTDDAADWETGNGDAGHIVAEELETHEVLDKETEKLLEEHLDANVEELVVQIDPLDFAMDRNADRSSPHQTEGNAFEESFEPQREAQIPFGNEQAVEEGFNRSDEQSNPQQDENSEANYVPISIEESSQYSEIEPAFAPEAAVAPKDLPLPYDESYDEEDKHAAGAPPLVPIVAESKGAVADKLPSPNAQFTRDQIISKNCSLCYFNGADDFWLQLDPSKVASLMQEIDEFSTKNDFAKLPPFQGAVGKACLSCYKESDAEPGLWHRGVVSAMNGDVGTVFYVDFGNSCPMKISEMKSLPVDLAEHPPLAYRCTLEGIESSETDLTEQFVDLFWLSTPVTVQFKKMKAGKFCVRLLRTTDGLDLNEKLGLPA